MAAAIAATASIGASSASAEIEVCSTNTSPCTGTMWETGKIVKASLTPETFSELVTSLGTVKCKKSELTGKQAELRATERLQFVIETVSFSECSLGASSCTLTAQHLPYLDLLLLNAKKEWHFIIHEDPPNDAPLFKLACTSGMNCTFRAGEILVSLLNPTLQQPHMIMHISVPLEREGSFCPTTSTWKVTYLMLEPLGFFAVG